jgi:hypothetical protein
MVLSPETQWRQPTWNRFVQMVNNHFGPPLTDSPIGDLAHLRCDGVVDDYCSKFMGLSCREPTLSKSFQVQLFIAGLSAALHADVELLQPATLDEAVKFTRAYEQRNNAMAKLSTGTAK